MVNSRVSRQWFCDKYAINALRVYGGDDSLERISDNVGGRDVVDNRAPLDGRDELGSIVRRPMFHPSSIDVLGDESREVDLIEPGIDCFNAARHCSECTGRTEVLTGDK